MSECLLSIFNYSSCCVYQQVEMSSYFLAAKAWLLSTHIPLEGMSWTLVFPILMRSLTFFSMSCDLCHGTTERGFVWTSVPNNRLQVYCCSGDLAVTYEDFHASCIILLTVHGGGMSWSPRSAMFSTVSHTSLTVNMSRLRQVAFSQWCVPLSFPY